jgi:ADP-ribosyl-[dinitrogen reductase] hydrolase
MDPIICDNNVMNLGQDRLRGIAVGAVVGDALGMPLEFHPARPIYDLQTEMTEGPLPAGSFTDDTEMALALAEVLLVFTSLDPDDLAQRFAAWYQSNPPDIGIHTGRVLGLIAEGTTWQEASHKAQEEDPENASNGSLMRAWPVAIARWQQPDQLIEETRLQSLITHTHPDCLGACTLLNYTLYELIHRPAEIAPDAALREAISIAADKAELAKDFRLLVELAGVRSRETLANTGWVRHTVECALWAVLTTRSFEEALVQAVNLGEDADTTGCVAGAIAGALYGLEAIPRRWKEVLRGKYPLGSDHIWSATDLVNLADKLAGQSTTH